MGKFNARSYRTAGSQFMTDPTKEPPMLTVAEIATLWNCSKRTVIRRLRNESGIRILGGSKRLTRRIPLAVLQRVQRQMTKAMRRAKGMRRAKR